MEKRLSVLRHLVEDRGLRAQLKSGNLLTGQLYVALDYYPGTPKVKLDLRQEEIVLPVVPGTFAVLEAKLTSILDKIDRMPLGFAWRASRSESSRNLKPFHTHETPAETE